MFAAGCSHTESGAGMNPIAHFITRPLPNCAGALSVLSLRNFTSPTELHALAPAIALMALLCFVALRIGVRAGLHWPRRLRLLAHLLAVTALVGYFRVLWNRPVMAALLPTSHLVILANWLPLWGSFFVGSYFATPGVPLFRRVLVGSATVFLCGYSCVAPILGKAPACSRSSLSQDLVAQSTPNTCSAACAASLLRLHGVSGSEGELARLCLTRSGTHWLGLYRGLKIKTELSEWTVEAEPFSVDALRARPRQPAVLSLSIDPTRLPEDKDHGFSSEVGHSVVYLGPASRGRVTVFDPSPDFGVECWDDAILAAVREGVIIRLIPRDPQLTQPVLLSKSHILTLSGHDFLAGL